MIIRILLALCWFTITGLISIDYLERLREKGDRWRAILAFPILIILAPFIGLGGVAGEIMDALIDDGGGDGDDSAHV